MNISIIRTNSTHEDFINVMIMICKLEGTNENIPTVRIIKAPAPQGRSDPKIPPHIKPHFTVVCTVIIRLVQVRRTLR